jgi:hypothetical protein
MTRAVVRQSLLALLFALPLAAAQDVPVRLVEPADGGVLTGGSTAVIRWLGTPGNHRDIEEWEAFLSVDGGRYYSARITPHLDVAIHEFRWTVPNVASHNVRILLRFGNEKDEHVTELPVALTIEPSPTRMPVPDRVSTPGESARPGEPGVVQWADGDRSGMNVAQVAASVPEFANTELCAGDERFAIEPPAASAQVLNGLPAATRALSHSPRTWAVPLIGRDVLLRCSRLNI